MYKELFQRIKMSDFPIECRAAYAFAKYKHKQTGAVRKGNGLPYIVHPKGVALIVLENDGSIDQINAAADFFNMRIGIFNCFNASLVLIGQIPNSITILNGNLISFGMSRCQQAQCTDRSQQPLPTMPVMLCFDPFNHEFNTSLELYSIDVKTPRKNLYSLNLTFFTVYLKTLPCSLYW